MVIPPKSIVRYCLLVIFLVLFIYASPTFFTRFFNELQSLAMANGQNQPGTVEQAMEQASPNQPIVSPLACNVSGLLSNNTTWSSALCNEYIAIGSIIVDTTAILTVEPGTLIKWDPGTTLTIRGTLLAKGTADQLVTFTSNQSTPKAGDWGGIEFVDSSKDAEYDNDENYLRGSTIQYGVIEYAGKRATQTQASPTINAVNASPYIDNTIIRDNQGMGIYIRLYTD